MLTRCTCYIPGFTKVSSIAAGVRAWFADQLPPIRTRDKKNQTHLCNCSTLLWQLKRIGVDLPEYKRENCDRVVLSVELVKLAIAYTLGSESPDHAITHLEKYNDSYKRLLRDNSVNVPHFEEAMRYLNPDKEMSVGDLAHKLHLEYDQIMDYKFVIQKVKEYVQ